MNDIIKAAMTGTLIGLTAAIVFFIVTIVGKRKESSQLHQSTNSAKNNLTNNVGNTSKREEDDEEDEGKEGWKDCLIDKITNNDSYNFAKKNFLANMFNKIKSFKNLSSHQKYAVWIAENQYPFCHLGHQYYSNGCWAITLLNILISRYTDYAQKYINERDEMMFYQTEFCPNETQVEEWTEHIYKDMCEDNTNIFILEDGNFLKGQLNTFKYNIMGKSKYAVTPQSNNTIVNFLNSKFINTQEISIENINVDNPEANENLINLISKCLENSGGDPIAVDINGHWISIQGMQDNKVFIFDSIRGASEVNYYVNSNDLLQHFKERTSLIKMQSKMIDNDQELKSLSLIVPLKDDFQIFDSDSSKNEKRIYNVINGSFHSGKIETAVSNKMFYKAGYKYNFACYQNLDGKYFIRGNNGTYTLNGENENDLLSDFERWAASISDEDFNNWVANTYPRNLPKLYIEYQEKVYNINIIRYGQEYFIDSTTFTGYSEEKTPLKDGDNSPNNDKEARELAIRWFSGLGDEDRGKIARYYKFYDNITLRDKQVECWNAYNSQNKFIGGYVFCKHETNDEIYIEEHKVEHTSVATVENISSWAEKNKDLFSQVTKLKDEFIVKPEDSVINVTNEPN